MGFFVCFLVNVTVLVVFGFLYPKIKKAFIFRNGPMKQINSKFVELI